MAGEVIVDALPYIDQGYDEPGIREAAISMVEDEKRRYRPSKNYLEHLPPLNVSAFETEMMRTEFDRLQQRLPMETMSMKRYELPPPPAGKLTDMSAWNECLENSMAQLEHQATRITNLELMTDYGTEAWKSYLEVLVKCVAAAQTQVAKFEKTNSRSKFPTKKCADASWRKIKRFRSQLGRIGEQELRDRIGMRSLGKTNKSI
ncbi:uncharacterized protein LOC100169098 [Acyrthosiphon pisum]|uniref:Pre-mRNA-splicing factor SPF27 n=1 Tax=Acyrthosiphon pisum TaxID=7029 RepID=C4WXM3_ACYPI|nr:uncharacterized protein LOC100169098 [Acyrthosiphon pisum]BAH72643.1 ACYPI003266 [Acyrthosiphon pisum]|eukprot:NP_001280388.1 uncharacterized protein LOC100169098 [Acyrthosiphon pisum]